MDTPLSEPTPRDRLLGQLFDAKTAEEILLIEQKLQVIERHPR